LSTQQKVRLIIAKSGGFFKSEDDDSPSPPPPFIGGSDGLKRNIPKNHDFDPKALKPLARMLFSSSVSLGHAVAAYKEFTRLKSARISPDGMLGGRGYVTKVKDIRSKLQQACELLSSITDTVHDEINAPHWQPSLAELGANDAEDVTEFMEEAEEVLEDPEAFGEKEVQEIEKKNDGPGGTPNTKPKPKSKSKTKTKDKSSELPGGGDAGNEAIPQGESFKQHVKNAMQKQANSSVSPATLPGPRVDHLDRGEQTGPYGSYNRDEPLTEDAWGLSEGVDDEYDYESDFSNNLLDKTGLEAWGESAIPDATSDPTETEGRDFGIGYGAKGRGTEGYGTKSPDGRGVYGPSSDLPNDPGAPTRDTEEGAGPYLDGVERNVWAGCGCGPQAESKLPFDGPDPVARSDYFEGNKGNQFNVTHQGEHVHDWRMLPDDGSSRVPGDQVPPLYNYDRDLMDVGQSLEHQDPPYVKYDWTTHNYRNDIQDVFRHEDDDRGSNG